MNDIEVTELENYIKESFNHLWNIRHRGESLEITTPFVTINSDFVTVFLTKKNSDFWIVTDGGWLDDGRYGVIDYSSGNKIIDYFRKEYEIKSTTRKTDGRIINWIGTKEEKMIPTIIYNLATFISQVVSSIEVYSRIQ